MRLDTPRQLYQHRHTLTVGCMDCRRWRELSFLEIDRMGVADREVVRLKFRCSVCGEPASKQVRAQHGAPGGAHRH